MTTPKIDNEDIERLIDIIGDGDLTAEAQERLHQEGLWPLYESLPQTLLRQSRRNQDNRRWVQEARLITRHSPIPALSASRK